MKLGNLLLLSGIILAHTSLLIQPNQNDTQPNPEITQNTETKNLEDSNNKNTVTHHNSYTPGYPSYFGIGMYSSSPELPPPPPHFAIGHTPVQTTYNIVHYPSHTQTPWNLHSYPRIFDPYHGHLHRFHPLHHMSHMGPFSNPMYGMMSMMHPHGYAYNPYINPFMMGMNPMMMGMNPMMMHMMTGLMNPMMMNPAAGGMNPMGGAMMGQGMMDPRAQSSYGPQGTDAPNQQNPQIEMSNGDVPVNAEENRVERKLSNDIDNKNNQNGDSELSTQKNLDLKTVHENVKLNKTGNNKITAL